jgi:hypothetical protein
MDNLTALKGHQFAQYSDLGKTSPYIFQVINLDGHQRTSATRFPAFFVAAELKLHRP